VRHAAHTSYAGRVGAGRWAEQPDAGLEVETGIGLIGVLDVLVTQSGERVGDVLYRLQVGDSSEEDVLLGAQPAVRDGAERLAERPLLLR